MDDFIVGSDVSQISIHSSQDVLSDAESFEEDEKKRKSSHKDTKMDKKRKRKEKKEQTNRTDKRGRRSNRVEEEARGRGGGCKQERQRQRLIQASSSQGLSSDASQDDDEQDARLREEITGRKGNVNHSREDRALNTGVHSPSRESKAELHKIILNSDSENDGKYPGAPSQKGNTPPAVLQASKQKHACTKRRVPSSESEEDGGGKQTREKWSMEEEARLSENAAKRKKERDPDVRENLLISPQKRGSSQDEVESNRCKTNSNSKRQHDAHSPGTRSPRARPSHTPDRKTRGQSALAATLADMGIDPLKDPQFAAEIAVSAHIPCCIGCHRIV
jgi:hypothetical protein